MDPAGLKRILREQPALYPKAEAVKGVLRPAIGESLFIAEGSRWLWQRRAAAPTFSKRNIQGLAPTMLEAAEQTLEILRSEDGSTVELHALMIEATFDVINKVLFAGNQSIGREIVQRSINDYIDQTARASLLDIIAAPAWIPRIGRLFRPNAVRVMQKVAEEAIRRSEGASDNAPQDLLTLLRKGRDLKTGRRMSPQELRDNLLTLVVAGHETTAIALSWTLYLLAFDPDVQKLVRTEVREALGHRRPTIEDLESLHFTRMVLMESLRLYPSAALLVRTALEADEIGGREVRPGDTMLLPIYALHRSHCWWEDPDRFDPERFRDLAAIEQFAYLPFGGGPRICIGSNFAIQESLIMIATLISEFRFSLVDGHEPEPVMILTLRPKNGVVLKVESIRK